MKISLDIAAFEASFAKVQEDIINRMHNMVKTFTYNMTIKAIDNTPYGTYNPLYNLPARLRVLPPKVGSAKGGWTVTMNEASRVIFPDRADDKLAGNIKSFAHSDIDKYQLGDTIYLMNSVPYVATEGWTNPKFGSLEGGYSREQAPNGIMSPTVTDVMNIYNLQLDEYYKA